MVLLALLACGKESIAGSCLNGAPSLKGAFDQGIVEEPWENGWRPDTCGSDIAEVCPLGGVG